ncbi:hypothetical protein ES707_22123 [subsurface metagenome]
MSLTFPPHCCVHLLGFSKESVEDAVFQRHPFPERPSRHVHGWNDFAFFPTRHGIDKFAGLVIAQEERVRRGDHGITVDHKAFRQPSFPKHRAVEPIERHERVQEGLLALVPGNMSEGLEHAATGGNSQLRRRTIARLSEELRQVWCADEAIL